MAKTYLPAGGGLTFKSVLRFVGPSPLDGRNVVDSLTDIQGISYKTTFGGSEFENVDSYYEGMLVVTKDTGKLYVLHNGTFKEFTPDLSNIESEINSIKLNYVPKNEFNAKLIKINNLIPSFSGFMTEEDNSKIKNEYCSTGPFDFSFSRDFAHYGPLSVYYNTIDNHFYYKFKDYFYYDWSYSYIYNTDSEHSIGRNDVMFSYNNLHYIVINSTLLNISAIEETLNSAINAKIKYLPNQEAYDSITPEDGVLYLIGEE